MSQLAVGRQTFLRLVLFWHWWIVWYQRPYVKVNRLEFCDSKILLTNGDLCPLFPHPSFQRWEPKSAFRVNLKENNLIRMNIPLRQDLDTESLLHACNSPHVNGKCKGYLCSAHRAFVRSHAWLRSIDTFSEGGSRRHILNPWKNICHRGIYPKYTGYASGKGFQWSLG